VPPEQALPGCGREGALVTFFVGDQQAAQTVEWHAGEHLAVDLVVGPPFAWYSAGYSPRLVEGKLVPYIGNQACGYATVVYSAEQQVGCGVEGSVVTFKLLDAQGNVVAVANQTGIWHAWDGVSEPQQLNLTFGPAGVITMPGTGTGQGWHRGGSVWGQLSLMLGCVGLAGAATGLAFRRHPMTR
jgi:hypothetical protein